MGRLLDRCRAAVRGLRAELWSSDSTLSNGTLAILAASLALMALFLVIASVHSGAGAGAIVAAIVCGGAATATCRLLDHRIRNRSSANPRPMAESEVIGELDDPDVSIGRSRALVRRLRRIGTDQSVAVLLDCARSGDVNLSVDAVSALARVGSDEAVDALIECLGMETGPRFTVAAVGLSKLHSRRAMPALRDCLESRGHELRRGQKRTLITALGGVPHASSVPVLSRALRDRSYRIRNAAAWALAQIRAPESSAALEAAADELSWLRAFPVRRGLRIRKRRDDHG